MFLQVVPAGSLVRTALSGAPVGKEGDATQQLESVSVALVGRDSSASKVASKLDC